MIRNIVASGGIPACCTTAVFSKSCRNCLHIVNYPDEHAMTTHSFKYSAASWKSPVYPDNFLVVGMTLAAASAST